MTASWQFWALGSAVFAALTAILAKVGVTGVNPDYATAVRTAVILILVVGIAGANGQFSAAGAVSGRAYIFLVLSGLATGASWLCYFRALGLGDAGRVAPVDKLSVVLVALFGTAVLGERLGARAWLGVLLIFLGVLLVLFDD